MKKILILGAGMVVKPMVSYLLQKGFFVTIAAKNYEKAADMIKGYAHAQAIEWSVEESWALDEMIKTHDIIISMLPWIYHVGVAKHCIRNRKNMVTTSYVKPEMKALEQEVQQAGIIILNELGLDPGIDHMSAMRIIDHIHAKGGSIEKFLSICGALPAPEAANNPFRYKFSWSPKGVVMASNNDAKYLKNGNIVEIPTVDLLKNPLKVNFPEVGLLEIYPNRDSLPYIELYGVPEIQTLMRGTFRHPGWCESINALKSLSLITGDKQNFSGKTYAEMLAKLIGEKNADDIRSKAANHMGISTDAYALDALEWLGLFESAPMNRGVDSPFEITSDLMIEKMELGPNERDMVVMQHIFLATYPDGQREVIKSSLLDYGTPATDTAVARTVALPAAIGVEMILENKIQVKGIHIPTLPEIYNPILEALEELGISMKEEFGLPESEFVS